MDITEKLYKFVLPLLTAQNFEDGLQILLAVSKQLNEKDTLNQVLQTKFESITQMLKYKDEETTYHKQLLVQNNYNNVLNEIKSILLQNNTQSTNLTATSPTTSLLNQPQNNSFSFGNKKP